MLLLEPSSFSGSFLEKIIKESGSHLGYGELKNKQMKTILSFVQGNDTFVALPTGYGKSLIYAVLPYVFDIARGNVGTLKFTERIICACDFK